MPKVDDIAMFAGAQFYKWPQDYSEEAIWDGASKAIPGSSIPFVVPGATHLVIISTHGNVFVTHPEFNLVDLGLELVNEYVVGKHEPDTPTKKEMVDRWIISDERSVDDWKLAAVYDRLVCMEETEGGISIVNKLEMCYWLREAERAGDLQRLEEKYMIEYGNAFIGYTYLTGIQYVAKEGETELPNHLKGKGVEIVRVINEESES